MMDGPGRPTDDIWNGLRDTSQALLEGVENRLRDAGLPPLSWYDVLREVERCGARGVRPVELQERLGLPQYLTSRLTDRMERKALVTRTPTAGDGRGQLVLVTRVGRSVRERMAKVYDGFLAQHVETALDPKEEALFLALLRKLHRRAMGPADGVEAPYRTCFDGAIVGPQSRPA